MTTGEDRLVRHVMVLAGLFPPAVRGGGPIRSLDTLVSTHQPGYAMHVLASNADLGQREPLPVEPGTWLRYRAARVMYLDVRSPRSLVLAIRELRRIRPDLYYLNSFFSPWFTILPLILIRLGIIPRSQVLMAPRGELSDGALAIKSAKKQVYLRLFALSRVAPSITWHAASERERSDIELAVSGPQRIIIWEKDTMLPPDPAEPSAADWHDSRLLLVFLSRISPKKGLATLLTALRNVPEKIQLDIYGPLEDKAYWARCQALIEALPGNVQVEYCGMVSPKQAVPTFSQYDLFAFPTAGENFGHVIAESLAASCPVMITDTTPWSETLRGGGGVVLDSANPATWAVAITEYARLSPKQRLARRRAAGRAYLAWRNRPRGDDLFELATSVP